MSVQPPAQPTTTQPTAKNAVLPSLANTKVKTRKRNAVTKYEPTVFRDEFLKLLPSATVEKEDSLDYDAYTNVLEQSAEKLDYKKYADPFFQILIVGGLIAPGGTVIDDGSPRNQFSLFSGNDTEEAILMFVQVLNKLIRRYKYLQRKLDDALDHLLQYCNKFGDDTHKLAVAVGMFFSMGLASVSLLNKLSKDHLVKDGTSLEFLTTVFKRYSADVTVEQFHKALKLSGVGSKLLEFFPVNKREDEDLIKYFEEQGLKILVDHHKKNLETGRMDVTFARLQEMFGDGNTLQEIAIYTKEQMTEQNWSAIEVLPLLWDAMMQSVDWGTRPEQIETQLIKTVKTWAQLYIPFCQSPKAELTLLRKIQRLYYEDARFMRSFSKTLQILYGSDVLGEASILYWGLKGASSHGKTVFMKQTDMFLTWLKTQDGESEEE